MKRLALTALAVVATAAVAPVSYATTSAQPKIPVSVTHDQRGVCVTVSYQVPQCVPVSTT